MILAITISFSPWWIPVMITVALLASVFVGSRGGTLGDAIDQAMTGMFVLFILVAMWIGIGFGWLVTR